MDKPPSSNGPPVWAKPLSRLDLDLTLNAPLGPLTWYGVGGWAEALVEPRSIEALAAVMQLARRCDLPVRLLGRGANLLVAERRVPGMVIRLGDRVFRHITIQDNQLTAGAGADLAQVILASARAGLGGLEGLAGIPASVGGAVRMNAGGQHGCVSDPLRSVLCMNQGGEVIEYPRPVIEFGYRHCGLSDPVILQATFDLQPGDPKALREQVKQLTADKAATQPLGARSAGCVFKNPPPQVSDLSAGQLIDQAGLKGRRVGRASVSAVHANFIVAQPGGTADEIIQLIGQVQQAVAREFGVELEREVVIWPDDEP